MMGARDFALSADSGVDQCRAQRRSRSAYGDSACPIRWCGCPPRRSTSCPISGADHHRAGRRNRADQLRHAVYAMLAPAFVVVCNVIEGQIVTPLIVGRRLRSMPSPSRGGCLLVLAVGLHRRADRRAPAGRHQSVLRPFRELEACRQLPLRAKVTIRRGGSRGADAHVEGCLISWRCAGRQLRHRAALYARDRHVRRPDMTTLSILDLSRSQGQRCRPVAAQY